MLASQKCERHTADSQHPDPLRSPPLHLAIRCFQAFASGLTRAFAWFSPQCISELAREGGVCLAVWKVNIR